MDTIDFQDKFDALKKYIKYFLLLIPLIIIVILIKGCGTSYHKLENEVEKEALRYIQENNIPITGEQYIELSLLDEIEGTELCQKASGVIVKNENGQVKATAYLKCDDYESEIVKNKEKYATLNGDTIMLLNYGEAFIDPLYTLNKDVDIEVEGYVGKEPGVYTLKYLIYDKGNLEYTMYRKVIVTKSDKTSTISGIENKNIPTIILNGANEITLYKGEKYVEPGYKAVDYTDGKISRKVIVSPNKISTDKVSSYEITYSVTNSKGATAYKKRIVNVIERTSDLSVSLRKEEKEISNSSNLIIEVSGKSYSHMILPNGEKKVSSKYVYSVYANGDYRFKVFDIYGNSIVKEINVDSIDNIPPTGSCKAIVDSSGTKISVSASDNKGISGYSYILDNDKSDYVTTNNYENSKHADSVAVEIKDIAGNIAKVNCEVEKKPTVMISGACGPSDVFITINTCYRDQLIRKDVPLEEYLVGVLYGEESPGLDMNQEFIKAFIIFARSFTLKRTNYWSGNIKPIRSCSSDQNWCDVETGCYRDQTQDMFNACIDYAVRNPGSNYSASTCADRVTTFPGTANVSNKTFYVNNSAWTKARVVTSTHVRSSWHGPLSEERKEFYRKMVAETAGLVIKTADGKPASVGYYLCDHKTNGSIMCPNVALELANQGYSMQQLIAAYTKDYPGAYVECYNK